MKIIPQEYVSQLLEKAGVAINGTQPWDIRVNRPFFYKRIMFGGTLGAGESYMDGDWDCEALDELSYRLYKHNIFDHALIKGMPSLASKYGDRFYRMWRLYLLTSAGCFRARLNQLWQVVLSPKGVVGGYKSVR